MDAGFNMRKWASNSKQLMDRIDKTENEKFVSKNSQCRTGMEKSDKINSNTMSESIKVLGISWNPDNDTLQLEFTSVVDTAAQDLITKRLILSVIARVYDPLGLLSPAIIPLKHIFQQVCLLKVNWDTQLPKEICDTWSLVTHDFAKNPSVEIKRSILVEIDESDINSIELHGFADASQTAFGCVVYLRIKTGTNVTVRLLTAKSKISPLKGETIPRLELMAALLLAQLITSVNNALKNSCQIKQLFCWSDSQIVLYWIYGVAF